MSSSRQSAVARIGEWIFRRGALRSARMSAPKANDAFVAAADQARLLVEVARRVAEPVEALPKGSRVAVLCALYRDALYWALVAEQLAVGAAAPADLAQAWSATPPERLLKAAGDTETLATVRAALVDRSASDALQATAEETARARTLVEALLWDLDAPVRAVERIQVQRWTRTAAVAVVLVAVVFGINVLARGPNLVATKVFKTSSTYAECSAPNHCADIFFHTLPQESPWIDFDLGGVKDVRRVEVTNRTDCCSERSIPLVVETSIDDKQWVQVARRDTEFAVWKASFPKQKARYVRFRVPRSTVLHFDDVVIR